MIFLGGRTDIPGENNVFSQVKHMNFPGYNTRNLLIMFQSGNYILEHVEKETRFSRCY